MKGNVSMLIWLGKQTLGQKDQQEVEGDLRITINKIITDERPEE